MGAVAINVICGYGHLEPWTLQSGMKEEGRSRVGLDKMRVMVDDYYYTYSGRSIR